MVPFLRTAAGAAAIVVAPALAGVLGPASGLSSRLADLWAPRAAAQAPGRPGVPIGKPLVQNYHHRDFRAEVQNWDVLQGDSGILYFANNAGVLEYDGRTWRLIELPSRLDVRSLVKDARRGGRIYVGATGDFGYLGPDAVGELTFHSLLPPEARQDKSFDQTFVPAVTPEGICFQARNKLCHWVSGRLACEDIEPSLSRIFAVGDHNYVQKKAGLMQLAGRTLRPVPGGEIFTGADITVLLPYTSGREERLLVGTRDFKVFVQRGATFAPFAADLRPLANLQDELLRGTVLPDGSFVFATQRRGVLIVDREGRLLQQIDQSAGLQENHVHAVWPDRDGGLWLALQNGVARVDVGSPFSIFDERFGLEREWREVVKHQGTLYVRGYKGLYAADAAMQFRRLTEIEAPVWSFVEVGESLLVSSRDSIFELRGQAPPRRVITYPSTPMTLYRSRSDPGRVYVGLSEGVASLHLTDGTWRDEGRLTGIDEMINSMAEGTNGTLWLVSQRQRILRVEFTGPPTIATAAAGDREPAQKPSQQGPRVRVFAFGRGTLTGRVTVREVTGRPVFLTETGIFEFDAASESFIRSPSFAALTEAGRSSFSYIAEDARGDVWVASRRPGAVDILRRQLDGRYVADNASLLQMPAWSVYPEPQGGVVWLSAPDYLLRYDLSIQTRAADFRTLIRRVTVNEDTVVFGGASEPDASSLSSPPATSSTSSTPTTPSAASTAKGATPTAATASAASTGTGTAEAAGPAAAGARAPLGVPYWSNSLHFEFAAPRYEHAERSEFQSYLHGFDRHWSGWSKEPSRSYTNLPPGPYTFHVRARDARGVVGQDAVFAFSVLRPWYRSWLAYVSYAVLVCGALIAVWKVQLQRAQLRMQREVEHLELEKLRELDRMKSRFFTDISHEFRTPLTLILGPIGQILQEVGAHDARQAGAPNTRTGCVGDETGSPGARFVRVGVERLLLVRRNAEYLLRLISQLLDLSKVESGTMRLRAAEGDLVPVLRTIVMQFAAVADQQGIDLQFEPLQAEDVTLHYDREVLEKIVTNLLTNACKFTPRGGTVRVRVRNVAPEGAGRENWTHGFAEIAVADTGIGMRLDQLVQIFNRFYQGDSSRSREGIGVGLALVKELVELHGGTIAVESEQGQGTTFTVRLPKGRAHLTADQIVTGSIAPAIEVTAKRTALPELAPAAPLAPASAPASATASAPASASLPSEMPPSIDDDSDTVDLDDDVYAADAGGTTVAAAAASAVVAVDEEAVEEAQDQGTVLIVEDHADVRAFIRDHLQPYYRVLEAKDGAEGLEVAVSHLPDLVLSDVMMGPMNGYELCKALKTNEKTCHIPVVLLTARAGRDDKLMGLDIGADCYLIKPFDPSELLVQVRNLIDQRRLLRERFSGSVILKPSEMAVTPMDKAFLSRVLAVVEQNLSDPEFDVERLGREVGLSRSQLHRKLRALTNQPPTLLIRSIRLQRAAELFKQDAGSVAEVAYLVGFSSQAYFAKCFREQFGCAPRDYARAALQA